MPPPERVRRNRSREETFWVVKGITILVVFPLVLIFVPTLSAQVRSFCTLEPRTCRPDTEVTFSLLLTNPSGFPIWEVKVSIPEGFRILDVLPPQDWGYAVEENRIVYQALADYALIPEKGREEFEFSLRIPALGEAKEKGFAVQVSARNTREEVMEENLELMVDNLSPTLEVEPKILGCGEVRLEVLAGERLANLSAYLLLENSRIPLQLSTKDGIVFEAKVRTQPGVEEPASLLIENAWDLAGNSPVENVLPLKVDTIPPRVENCWLERDGRVIAVAEIQESPLVRTSERKPEILIAVSDGSGIENWGLEVSPDFPREQVFENGIIRVIPKTELSGDYTLVLTVGDRASPPNRISRVLRLEVRGGSLESVLRIMLPLILLVIVAALWARKRGTLLKKVQK
jgi:hypothetical protein